MIPPRMSRPVRVILTSVAIVAVSALAAACGTQRIDVPQGTVGSADRDIYTGAVLFSQRCAGCHTLSYAGTHGSASNVRTAQANNGPNFNVRCERPAIRVLYAIENGGFSGAIMPQNVVVGKDALDVAEFVAKYAGRQAPTSDTPGAVPCIRHAMGPLPSQASAAVPAATTTTTALSGTAPPPAAKKHQTSSKKTSKGTKAATKSKGNGSGGG
jgi:mono/diheme cytochrome c family protein